MSLRSPTDHEIALTPALSQRTGRGGFRSEAFWLALILWERVRVRASPPQQRIFKGVIDELTLAFGNENGSVSPERIRLLPPSTGEGGDGGAHLKSNSPLPLSFPVKGKE